MTPEQFTLLIQKVTSTIAGKPLDPVLQTDLNARFPAGSAVFESIRAAIKQAVAAGWMCNREAGGIKFGRVIKPGDATHGFSVDVVDMDDCAGPHHRHPNGEIDMVLPLAGDARFDGHGTGWCVYGPNTAHYPTVTGGRAHVLYLLPQGAIEFTK